MARADRPVTLEDVARACGYSRATVSRVVNGQSSVDPTIAAAVRDAIRRTGYSANAAARTLAGGSARIVGLVFAESFRELFQNPYWGEIVEGLSATLGEHGYRETFLVRDRRADLDTALAQGSMDAVIIMSPMPDDRLETRLLRGGTPVIVFGQPRHPRRTPSADIDEEATGALAAATLLERGCRYPVIIAGRADMQVSARRVQGFIDACTRAGVRVEASRVADGDFTLAGGARAAAHLMAGRRRVDGVFACSDRMALGALQALHALGRDVPQDVAVVGVDGTALGEQAQPRLTSVGADLPGLGATLGTLTLEALTGAPVRHAVLTPHVVRRQSA